MQMIVEDSLNMRFQIGRGHLPSGQVFDCPPGFGVRAVLCRFLLAFVIAALNPSTPGVAASKPIMVYYMPWYVAKPYSADWGWHWTMDHFKPDVINASGERQIASWYYP